MKPHTIKIGSRFFLLAAIGILMMGCSGGKDTKPPMKGMTKPDKPVIVRDSKPVESKTRTQLGQLKSDFDFEVVLNGKPVLGNNSWEVALQRADKGMLALTGPKQEALELRYRLDEQHPQLNLPQGLQAMRLDMRNAFVKGALVKHLTLAGGNDLVVGIYSGQSDNPLQLELPGRWVLNQGEKEAAPVRTDKEGGYYNVPVALKGPGQNVVLKPGESRTVGALTVRVLESEVRVLDPGSPIAAAFEEGGAYRYRIAIFR